MKKTYSIDDVATLLGVEADDVQSCIDEGRLAYLRVGKKYIITQASLDAFLETPTNSPTYLDNVAEDTVTLQQPKTRKDADFMKGSITTLKGRKKPYMYQILIGIDSDGKKIRESKSFTTRLEAEEAMKKRIAELSSAAGVSPKQMDTRAVNGNTLLSDYMQYYLDLEPTAAKARTRRSYYCAAKYIASSRADGGLGDLQLRELDDTLFLKFFNSLKNKLAQATLDRIYLVTNLAFRYAYKKGYIRDNIMDDVKKPKSNILTKKVEAYTDDELDTILTAAKDKYPEVYPILVTLADTGMRPGELRALKWSNLDWDNKTIKIEASIVEESEGMDLFDGVKKKWEVVGPTKSKSGVRKVFLSDRVIDALRDWQAYVQNEPDFILARDEEFVFTQRTGGFLKNSAMISKFKRFLRSTGLTGKGYTLYKFRHTFCTKLMNNGTPISLVKHLMGDSTLNVIINNYTSITDSDLKSAVEKLF